MVNNEVHTGQMEQCLGYPNINNVVEPRTSSKTHILMTCNQLICRGLSLFLTLCFVFTPLYLRIIQVFITNKKYKFRKGYRLMTQIGIAQCGTSPGLVLLSFAIALQDDPLGIPTFFMKIMNSCRRVEAVISVALALERIMTLFGVKKGKIVVDVLTVLAWLYGIVNTVLLNSPWADFVVVPEDYGASYVSTLPVTPYLKKASFYSSVGGSAITFVIYLVIIAQLLRQKLAIQSYKIEVHEKSIFAQALVRFIGDTTMTVMYHVLTQTVPDSELLNVSITLGYLVNNLVLPPLFSVIVSRSLRLDALMFLAKISTVGPANS
uniref:G protein-coupled receptor n=1 Tax=Steinernema glaseri TaxID=37863 RepID=A0A1I7Z698_9BILA